MEERQEVGSEIFWLLPVIHRSPRVDSAVLITAKRETSSIRTPHVQAAVGRDGVMIQRSFITAQQPSQTSQRHTCALKHTDAADERGLSALRGTASGKAPPPKQGGDVDVRPSSLAENKEFCYLVLQDETPSIWTRSS